MKSNINKYSARKKTVTTKVTRTKILIEVDSQMLKVVTKILYNREI